MPTSLPSGTLGMTERWILSRLNGAAFAVNRSFENFRFDEAAQAIYAFVWHDLCDGYVEMVKPVLAGKTGGQGTQDAARSVLHRCLSDALAMLHPFMPFVTEEIWEKLTDRPGTLIVSRFPTEDASLTDAVAERLIGALRELVTCVRNFRAQRKLSPTEPVALAIDPQSPDRELAQEIRGLDALLRHMARLSHLEFSAPADATSRDVAAGLAIGLAVSQEKEGRERGRRNAKTLARLNGEIECDQLEAAQSLVSRQGARADRREDRRRLVELKSAVAALSAGRRVERVSAGKLVHSPLGEDFENLASETDGLLERHRPRVHGALFQDPEAAAQVILAESQTKARGRKGDRWHAPADRGLYFTFVRPAAPGEPLSLVPIAVARWIRDAVEETTGVPAALKWPNDLYVESPKARRSFRRVPHTGRRDADRRWCRFERSRIGRGDWVCPAPRRSKKSRAGPST